MYGTRNNVVISANGEMNNLLISEEADVALKLRIKDRIKTYNQSKLTDKLIGTDRHVIAGIVYSNFLTCSKYQNVLFVPSFRNGKFPTLMDANYETLKSNASQHMTPIINKYFGFSPNIWVAFPDGHTSLYQDLMLEFGCNIIDSNGMYAMGADNYNVIPPEGVKFDAVFLAGHDIEDGTTFNAQDIKNDFAAYCTEDFDLIDDYQNDTLRQEIHRSNPIPEVPTRLTGTEKSIGDVVDYIGSNTMHDEYGDDNWKQNTVPNVATILKKIIKVY